MKRKILYALWAAAFILCAGLGFIPEPEGPVGTALTILSILFFLPPAILLYRAEQSDALLIRNLSALSLGLSLVVLVLNFLTAMRSEALGRILHYVLIIVSSPMICSGHWAMSLFLWACLLMVSLQELRKLSVSRGKAKE